METIKIVKTVFPDNRPKEFNEWAEWFWGQFKINHPKKENGWEKNIYIPKNQSK